MHGLEGKLNNNDIALNSLLIVLKHRHSNLHRWNENQVLDREFNVKVIMLALIPHPRYINTETSPNLKLHPGVNVFMMLMILMVWYVLFNLQNINALVPPKWKHNDHILEECKKFHCSCQHIFDGPMAHVTSVKVKTNMFLIWCGLDGEDIYDNFQLDDDKMYDIDYVMEQFELYCEPICNSLAFLGRQLPTRRVILLAGGLLSS